MAKKEREFFDQNTLSWHHPEGYPDGVLELIVAEDKTTNVLTHECWEEVYIIEGELICEDKVFTKGMVAVRPPGMKHGPFKTSIGALTYEVHYRRVQDK